MPFSEPSFVRVMRRRDVFVLAFGAMIGWSWIALSGNWIDAAGSLGAILAFVAGGLAVTLVGLTYAELAAAMPRAGGEHVYSYRALGRTASFWCTWAILLAYMSVIAFEAVALPTVIEHLFPDYRQGHLWTIAGSDVDFTWLLVAFVATIAMTMINIIGIEVAALVQLLITLLIVLAAMVLVVGAGISGEPGYIQPLFVDGAEGMLSVLVVVPMMLVGFDVIPQAAEEIDLPRADIGTTLVLAIVVAVIFYVVVIGCVAMGLATVECADSAVPTAAAASALLGRTWGGQVVVIGGIGGIVTAWNAFIIGASRALYALARAGQLPAVLGRIHSRYHTPYCAILLIGGLSLIAPLCGRQTMVWLVNAGSFGVIVAYAFVALSFLVLRHKEPSLIRPYRVRYGFVVGSLALVLSLGIMLLFFPYSPAALAWPNEWAIVLGWCLFGIILTLLARRDGNESPNGARR